MGLAHLVQVEEEAVHVVQRADGFVQRIHHRRCVFLQLGAGRLLVPRLKVFEFGEEGQQFLVLLE